MVRMSTRLENAVTAENEYTAEQPNSEKPPRGHRLNRKKRKLIFIVVMLALPLIQLFIFWFLVNVNTIIMAFQEFDWSSGKYIFNGFDNFIRVFREIGGESAVTRRAVINSVLYFPVTCFISLPLSILFSYFLYKKAPGSAAFRVIFFLPSIIPVAVLTMTFSFSFDATLGFVNPILRALGVDHIPSWFGQYPNNQIMIFAYCIWAGLGTNIVLISGAISRIPVEIMEYSKLEGVSKARELFQIAIPLVWPTISTTFVLGCTSVFTVMMQPLMLTPGSSDTQTIALMIYNGVLNGRNLPYLSAFGLAMSVIGVPIILVIKWAMGKPFADVEY